VQNIDEKKPWLLSSDITMTTASLRMQLMNGGIIFDQAYSINIHSAIGHEMFHFFVTFDDV